MNKGKVSVWSEDEDNFIRANYGRLSALGCASQLPGRTRNAVIGRAKRLGMCADSGRPPRVVVHRVQRVDDRPASVKRVVNPLGGKTVTRSAGLGLTKQVELTGEPTLDLPNLWCEPVSIIDRKSDQCCWPLDGNPALFCGLPRFETPPYGETQYCRAHYFVSVKPPGEHRRLGPRV